MDCAGCYWMLRQCPPSCVQNYSLMPGCVVASFISVAGSRSRAVQTIEASLGFGPHYIGIDSPDHYIGTESLQNLKLSAYPDTGERFVNRWLLRKCFPILQCYWGAAAPRPPRIKLGELPPPQTPPTFNWGDCRPPRPSRISWGGGLPPSPPDPPTREL